ncbi:MAG: hypothetical protein K6E91_06050 [Butyrivibrio sp.]|nr:hypothetical protein [Butyrivibrio sp.]
MSRTFRYIQNDEVLKTFCNVRDTILSERPLIIARHGDYILMLSKDSDDIMVLTTENTERGMVVAKRQYNIGETTPELVGRGVRHAIQKMSELSDADVNRKRLQIWKWYLLDWQKENAGSKDDFVRKEISWTDDQPDGNSELMDMEAYLHGEYLNMGNTLSIIEKYLADDEKHRELFKKFAVADIMEMTSEDTRDRSLEGTEKKRLEDGMKKHTYRFTVTVEATDKEHARQALLSYLAGDDRIKIQK